MKRVRLAVYLHFIWATWDREPMIPESIERDLHRYVAAVCRDDGCDLLAIGGMPDHLHLLVRFTNTLSLADFMKHVKGGSSHFLGERLSHAFKWQEGYGVYSCDPRTLDAVIRYIRDQKRHHAEGTLHQEGD